MNERQRGMGMQEPERKICADCKWYGGGWSYTAKCHRPEIVQARYDEAAAKADRDIVTGEIEDFWFYPNAGHERGQHWAIKGMCGIDGKFWEAKPQKEPSLLRRLLGWLA